MTGSPLIQRCHCGMAYSDYVLVELHNGAFVAKVRCVAGHVRAVPKESVPGGWFWCPVIRSYRDNLHPCARCRDDKTEYHHWAPFEFFGAEAEMWPGAWLCRGCHARWHDLMTVGRPADLWWKMGS